MAYLINLIYQLCRIRHENLLIIYENEPNLQITVETLLNIVVDAKTLYKPGKVNIGTISKIKLLQLSIT